MGERVAIYWPKNDEYYPGVITKVLRSGRVYIHYDDGDEQWVRLNKVCYLQLTGTATTDQRPDNPAISTLLIGTRVSVWWQGDKQFFEGTLVERKDPRNQDPHRVQYDDGDEEWLNLAFRRFRLLDDRKVKKEE